VRAFEQQHKLEVKEMTFLERLERMGSTYDSIMEKVVKNFEDVSKGERWGGKIGQIDRSDSKCGIENAILLLASQLDHEKPLENRYSGFTKASEKNLSILERTQYFTDPLRKKLTIKSRQNIHQLKLVFKSMKSNRMMLKLQTLPPKLRQTTPEIMSHAKSISLTEMNPTSDHIFENLEIGLNDLIDVKSLYLQH